LSINVAMQSLPFLLAIAVAASHPSLVQAKDHHAKKVSHGFLQPATPVNGRVTTEEQNAGVSVSFLARVRTLATAARRNEGSLFWAVAAALFCCTGACQAFAYTRSTGSAAEWDEGLPAAKQDAYGSGITFKQQWEAVELFGIEAKNRYLSEDPPMFIHEKSDGIQRILASPNRELTLFAHAGSGKKDPALLRMYKPWHCTGCECFINPQMELDLPDGKKVGRIDDPFDCCNMNQQIFDADDNVRFKVTGPKCQSGICCPLCADTQFEVTDKDDKMVGAITKPALNLGEACLQTNRFAVKFPEQCTMNDKALLVGSAMLLDLQYFDVKN